ncbi:hypothetical protein [Xanthomonas fragariae]|uniref:hypothetical protein n=1 Tax=Xanthomonas fragariae TaxID=48664 RepID=UPI001ABE356D|nr:hypothetical protein [Xanthomonas fragariae]UKR51362.1 hypothetical protein K4A87_10845 [Xanthomonas fragariae]
MLGFTALYTTPLVIAIKLSLKTIRKGLDALFPPTHPSASHSAPSSTGARAGSAP